ncbi:MAG: PilZ domain-containing protein [Candidatus Omnitrophota bacterium]|nr:PilZ domain-containing protein [Candidatus Omnitrophota bacterium]
MGEERRKSVRIKKVLTVRYSYGVNKDEKKWDITAIRDISETGMSITIHQEFSPNDIITFLIKIPTRPLEWIEFTGRVVGTEDLKAISGETLTGAHITRVEFINLKENQKELIREYITWFLTKEGGGQK